VKSVEYRLHYIVRMQQHIVIPKSQHPIPSRFKIVGALGVVPGLLLMLAAINLDHESSV
jgi:hypothetical protein